MLGVVFLLLGCSGNTASEFVFEKHEDGTLRPEKRTFGRFISALGKADATQARLMLDRALSKADSLTMAVYGSDALYWLTEEIGDALDEVNSPCRNPSLMLMALESEEKCLALEPADWRKMTFQRMRLLRNAPGRQVEDLVLYGRQGDSLSLRQLCRSSDGYTLIFIYGGSCSSCTKLTEDLAKNRELAQLIESGCISPVAIYTGDEHEDYLKVSRALPVWSNCTDGGAIMTDGTFDQREIPSLCLVSRSGIVRLRGARSVDEITAELRRSDQTTATIRLEKGEKVWGGRVADGRFMPFADGFSTALCQNNGNQVSPLLLTSGGRYVWSEEPFSFRIEGRSLVLEDIRGGYESAVVSKDLSGAYRFAMKAFFPPEGTTPPDAFFDIPQYNTWIELQYNQNQKGVLEYAKDILRNGLPAGILMIDDTWMEDYGKWEFHPGRFPSPKAMCDELHRMGFKVMLWITPFVSMDQYQLWTEINSFGGFLHTKEGGVYPVLWWNGMSAELDLTNPASVKWLNGRLEHLRSAYGVDGFKFDAGDFHLFPADAVTSVESTPWHQCELFMQFADTYPYNEYRASFKGGGKPIVQRLHDKAHSWEALGALIPEMTAANILGYWYSCPDMIGGGSFASFLPDSPAPDQDLVVRSAQTHAFMPMMQFSVAPWRILDKEHLNAVLESVKIRSRHIDHIKRLVKQAAETGEPVVAPLEYYYPGRGFAEVKDQFMLGSELMVAPQVAPGRSRSVLLPEGEWLADDGTLYSGDCSVEIDVPLARLPYFKKVNRR